MSWEGKKSASYASVENAVERNIAAITLPASITYFMDDSADLITCTASTGFAEEEVIKSMRVLDNATLTPGRGLHYHGSHSPCVPEKWTYYTYIFHGNHIRPVVQHALQQHLYPDHGSHHSLDNSWSGKTCHSILDPKPSYFNKGNELADKYSADILQISQDVSKSFYTD